MNRKINLDIRKEEVSLRETDPSKLIVEALQSLKDERMQCVLDKRFNVLGNGVETLESIGKSLGVTRERVRQIEKTALEKLREKEGFEVLRPLINNIEKALEVSGKMATKERLFRLVFGKEDSSSKHYASLILALEVGPIFFKSKKKGNLDDHWFLKGAKKENLKKITQVTENIFEEARRPLKEEILLSKIQKISYFKGKDCLSKDALVSYLDICLKFDQNPFGEWGLIAWQEIRPRGIRGKAYLVVRREGKPLHFKEIAKLINRAGFDDKKAYFQTVHNELIKDFRFVLVGRGTYALKEWGFQPGFTKDIIINVLKKAQKPLSKEEILKRVLKQRLVQKNTIILNLQGTKRIIETSDSKYRLARD